MRTKIKWIKNSRVKRNPKISQEDIVEKESDANTGDAVVTMTDITKEYPTINIHFPTNEETKENKIQNHDSGEWITKSWRVTEAIVATINTQENYIHFNRSRFTPDQLTECLAVINKVKELA